MEIIQFQYFKVMEMVLNKNLHLHSNAAVDQRRERGEELSVCGLSSGRSFVRRRWHAVLWAIRLHDSLFPWVREQKRLASGSSGVWINRCLSVRVQRVCVLLNLTCVIIFHVKILCWYLSLMFRITEEWNTVTVRRFQKLVRSSPLGKSTHLGNGNYAVRWVQMTLKVGDVHFLHEIKWDFSFLYL